MALTQGQLNAVRVASRARSGSGDFGRVCGWCIVSLPLGNLFSKQFLFRQFADRRLGEARTNLHLGWHLVFRELVSQEHFQFVDPKRRVSWLESDEGLGRLATIGVRDADDGDLSNGGVLVNRLLNVAGKHVE